MTRVEYVLIAVVVFMFAYGASVWWTPSSTSARRTFPPTPRQPPQGPAAGLLQGDATTPAAATSATTNPATMCYVKPWQKDKSPDMVLQRLTTIKTTVQNDKWLTPADKTTALERISKIMAEVQVDSKLQPCSTYCETGTLYDAGKNECHTSDINGITKELNDIDGTVQAMQSNIKGKLPQDTDASPTTPPATTPATDDKSKWDVLDDAFVNNIYKYFNKSGSSQRFYMFLNLSHDHGTPLTPQTFAVKIDDEPSFPIPVERVRKLVDVAPAFKNLQAGKFTYCFYFDDNEVSTSPFTSWTQYQITTQAGTIGKDAMTITRQELPIAGHTTDLPAITLKNSGSFEDMRWLLNW